MTPGMWRAQNGNQLGEDNVVEGHDDFRERSRGETRKSPYQLWRESEGIPTYRGSYVTDLYSLDVTPWPRVGQRGAFVNLADQEQDDAWIIEIEPAGATEILHHFCEATVFVLEGRGGTSFWQEGSPKESLEWKRGSIFAPPLNCYYQHFNGDGQMTARLLVITNAPMVMNLFREPDFVFNDTYVFSSRFQGGGGFFTSLEEKLGGTNRKTNFVADIRAHILDSNPHRGEGNFRAGFSMSNNSMAVHCSEFPPGTYKKKHRHGVGAHVIVLSGQGYSLLSFEGEKEARRVDWKDGSMLSPKAGEYHQHFNTGRDAARYMAVRLGALNPNHWEGRSSPDQVEYEDQDPSVYEMYVTECAKSGIEVMLPRPKVRVRGYL